MNPQSSQQEPLSEKPAAPFSADFQSQLSESPEQQSSDNVQPRFSRSTRRAILFSLAVNGLILLGLGVWYFRPGESRFQGPDRSQDQSAASLSAKQENRPVQKTEPEIKPLPGEKAQQTVERVLKEQQSAADTRTVEENRRELANQSDKLAQVSDEESIDQLSRQFQKWLNTSSRQTRPADVPPVTAATVTAENFDANSAQFHDILQLQDNSGRIAYQAVLLDAQGRTLLLDMSPEEGKPLYETMQKIKANPLMDKVYRQIIMPILDKELGKIQNRS